MRKMAERIAITCGYCGCTFHERASRNRKFCSKACEGQAAKARYATARIKGACAHCGAEFTARPYNVGRQYCSLQCRQTAVSRKTADQRSAKLRQAGAKASTYRKLNGRHEHRVVAEKAIGRPLRAGEVVHHKDENKHNNSPDNLEVLGSQSEHAARHTKGRLCTVPGCGRKHVGRGFCMLHWKRDRVARAKAALRAVEAGEMLQ